MNKVLIFLILLSFIVCKSSESEREGRKRIKKEHDRQLAECILNNAQSSPELREVIEGNKEESLLKVILHMQNKLEKSDNDIIRNCRIELIEKGMEEEKRKREQEKREEPNRDDL